jgi:hypothetical protein
MSPFSLWHLSSVLLMVVASFLKKACSATLAVVPGPFVFEYSRANSSAES